MPNFNCCTAIGGTEQLWLAYAIGCLGIIIEWRSYGLQSEQRFRRWSGVGALLWALQYLLLHAVTASLTMACTAVRTLVSGNLKTGWVKHCVAAGFVALFTLLTHLSWQGAVSLLPAFAVINTTLALFYLDNRRMRIALLFSSIAWISNDAYWQAWMALIAESVAMLINAYTISKLVRI